MNDQVTGLNSGLQKVVQDLTSRPFFLANVFARIFAGDVSAGRISRELGCTEPDALRLAMMRVPRLDLRSFREDLDLIVKATGADRGKLLSVVKQAQILGAFEANAESDMLLAARD